MPWTCVITEVNRAIFFAITDTEVYVPFVSSSTNNNVKLLDQLKLGFKRTINWNKYQSKVTIQQQNPSLHFLLDPSFQGVNRLLILSFPDNTIKTGQTQYLMPSVEIKHYNVMINGQNFFDDPVKNNIRTNNNRNNEKYDRSRGWLHNRLFTILSLLQWTL